MTDQFKKEREERERKARERREKEEKERKVREEKERKAREEKEKKERKERERKAREKKEREAKEKIECYCCGKNALQGDSPDKTEHKVVECPHCQTYEITDEAIEFFFSKDDTKELLSDEEREKVSEYIQENFDPLHPSPVQLHIRDIDLILHKEEVED